MAAKKEKADATIVAQSGAPEVNAGGETGQPVTTAEAGGGVLPESMAVANPAPSSVMDSASGAFIEPEIKESIPAGHPAVDNNPRRGTTAIQNGGDFNDPRGLHPSDPNFAGQGIDLSVYGSVPTQTAADDSE